ncbi:serine/threonine protein kinase [Thermoactinomyces mirandus]|uniref:non-specific serine/threonine protein kinase n=1 Tax=Thermoactinomyces mirandus TaxID=2756294 RepID=A0A7W1XRN1_9BACL|nr:serine/threonine protein kinase [Thermoactinomyces mirandus]MBA4601780.1 serine/threonine protein kinase [Thermoactinomyces mirandus]
MKHPFARDQEAIQHLSMLVESGKMTESYPLLGEGLSGKVFDFEGYAVKVFKEDYSENDDYKILRYLNGHPAFPEFHYIDGNHHWMVVDKVNGYTLGQVVKSGEKLRSDMYDKIEEIVEDCYNEGIVPADLHLNNIMIDRENQIRVIDTGRFFFTNEKEAYRSQIEEDLDCLQYHCGLFSFFSSSSRKYHRRRKYSSSYPRRRRYSSSYPRRRRYSSSDYRRSYSSSDRRYRRHKHRKYFSFSSS